MHYRPNLPRTADARFLVLFAISAILALLSGFAGIEPSIAARLIIRYGYYYILGVFAAWVYFAWRVAASEQTRVHGAWRSHLGVGAMLVGATAFAVSTDSFAHKVLFDEYVLQGTAWHMHLTKELGTPIRAYDFAGTWLVIDTFLDKRPYFFSFLISILHDFTGFRIANVYALNVALALVTLTATWWLVRAITGRLMPAFLAVALLATLPLFGQNATGASMELLNVAMIAVVMVTATLYLRQPSPDTLSLLVLGCVLLAQTRYESVLFVFPVTAVIVLGWLREGRIFLSWPAIAAPLLLVPYVWHDRYVTTKQHLWQLREGEEVRFAWKYLAGNLEGARKFLLSTSPLQPNSLWLVLLGVAGIIWGMVQLWERRHAAVESRSPLPPAVPVLGLFSITIAANLGILMFYYWSRLDEPVAARFALPLFLAFALIAGWFVHSLDQRRIPASRIAGFGLLVWLFVVAAPAYAHRFYTSQNLVMHELQWELEAVEHRKPPIFLITSKATMPFLLEKIPALNTSIARNRGPEIAWHMRHGTFREVLVSQVIRPSSAKGELIVDPDDELPDSFRLATLAEKRFGARWIRISRLVEIASDTISQSEIPLSGSR
jgi:hypothetical protein